MKKTISIILILIIGTYIGYQGYSKSKEINKDSLELREIKITLNKYRKEAKNGSLNSLKILLSLENKLYINLYKKSILLELEENCQLNNKATSCNTLSKYMREEENYKEAFNYYKKSCDLKNSDGCFYLGNYYQEGLGVKKRFRKIS